MPVLPETPFTCADLERLRLTPYELRRLDDRQQVRRVLRGVYVRADLPLDTALRARAAALVVPPGAVFCDDTARWLHGVPGADPDSPPPLDVASLSGREASGRAGLAGCKRSVPPRDVMELHGVKVTTPLRTAADLACRRGRNDAIAVLDGFCRVHGLTRADYVAIASRFARRRGVTQLRELGPLAIAQAESPPESWTRLAVIDHGLPAPEAQVETYLDELGWVRLDLAYRRERTAIEYDGVEFHTAPEDRQHDARRREALRRAGWAVVVVRRDGFAEPGLSTWVHELQAIHKERKPSTQRLWARGESRTDQRRRPRP